MGRIKAIDYLYYPFLKSWVDRYNEAKEGEIICRIERSLGGYPSYNSIEEMLSLMDEAGVDKVFLCQFKMFSYRNKRWVINTRLEEVAELVAKYPERFVGLAGYDPFHIKESLQEVRRAIKDYGFKGVYVHIYGFDIPINDPKMYPLYAMCAELEVPVILQVGHVLEAMPSECGRPIYLDRVAADFPELKLVGSHTGYPWAEELISVCTKWDNVWFGCAAWAPRYWSPAIVQFINSGLGRDRCIWGTNGLPWKETLRQIDELNLKEEAKRKLLRENATELFNL